MASTPSVTSFDTLYTLAAGRKGGPDAFERTLQAPFSADSLAATPDDRWLSAMSLRVFQAGFNWSVVENKWPAFEEAFFGFDPNRCAALTDEDIDALMGNAKIIRHGKKIRSVAENAAFVKALRDEHGSAGAFFAKSPPEDYVDLLWTLKKRASRLGGTTAQYFLRGMGVDGFILTRDVVRALIRDGVVERDPSSKRDLDAVQEAFNHWHRESGRPLMQISRVLACSIE